MALKWEEETFEFEPDLEEERLEILTQVASMYYEDGLTQNDISDRLGYSRSNISRLLSEARSYGIVEIHVHHFLERSRRLEVQLQETFGLHEVRVLAGKSVPYEQTLRQVGRLAARFVEHKIEADTILGISWGTAIYEVARGIRPAHLPGVKVVQLIGTVGSVDPQTDGPGLVRKIARNFEGEHYTLPAPWLISDESVRDALLKDRHLRETLELANRVTLGVVGVGTSIPNLSAIVRAGYLNYEEAKNLQEAGVAGDVCGLLFDIQGNLVENSLAGYVLGVQADVLRQVPLVAGVACGRVKATAILGALRSKLINSLVTDDTAAQAILDLNNG